MAHRPLPPVPRTRMVASALRAAVALVAAVLLLAAPGAQALRTTAQAGPDTAAGVMLGQGGVLATATPAAERWSPPSGGAPPSTAKTSGPAALAAVLVTRQRVRTATVQIAAVQRTALVALRRCRALFPFHFFW